MRLTYLTGRQRSTIWKVLHRHGCSRRRRSAQRESRRRYEWSEAGALLHIDAFQIPKFDAPGHWATGRRKERSRRVGKTVVIGGIDDHTRLAYCELHSAENAINVSRILRRGARWFEEQGCGPVQALMSDNAKCYARSIAFAETLTELGARHIQFPPYTPRWNGKIERFFGTLDSEWGARARLGQQHRARSLPVILRALLQPQAIALSRWRSAAHQPCSAGVSAGQLEPEPQARGLRMCLAEL